MPADVMLSCVPWLLAAAFASLAAAQGTVAPNVTANGTIYPNATFIPGWCNGCSQTQGIYVAVFIGILGTGVVVGAAFALWGAWRGRQLLGLKTYRHVEEETQLGKMVTLELAELSKKSTTEDYF